MNEILVLLDSSRLFNMFHTLIYRYSIRRKRASLSSWSGSSLNIVLNILLYILSISAISQVVVLISLFIKKVQQYKSATIQKYIYSLNYFV